ADRVCRIRADDHQVGIRRLERLHDWREVTGLRRRRIALVVDDLVAALLGVFARALAGVDRELGVGKCQRDGRRLRLLRSRDLEESLSEGSLCFWSGWKDREVLRVLELAVHVECKQA